VPTLHLYLTDGFSSDRVTIEVDGRTVFDEDGVSTRKLYGLAKDVGAIEVASDKTRVAVRLPRRGVEAVFEVDLTQGSHVPISVENGEIRHAVLRQVGFM
jgi:hypothetical protein